MIIKFLTIIKTIINGVLFLMAIRTENVTTNYKLIYWREKIMSVIVLINSILMGIEYGNNHKLNEH